MFVWTSGMHPGMALILFVVGIAFTIYTMSNAVRWTWGWDRDEESMLRGDGRGGSEQDGASDADFGPVWNCPFENCHADNPSHARFCRMCGRRRNGHK